MVDGVAEVDQARFGEALATGQVIKSGIMVKVGKSIFARRSERMFEIVGMTEAPWAPAVLTYRKDKEDRLSPRGIIKLADCRLETLEATDLVLWPVGMEGQIFELYLRNTEEREDWKKAIVEACRGGIAKVEKKKLEAAKKDTPKGKAEEEQQDSMSVLIEGELLIKVKLNGALNVAAEKIGWGVSWREYYVVLGAMGQKNRHGAYNLYCYGSVDTYLQHEEPEGVISLTDVAELAGTVGLRSHYSGDQMEILVKGATATL